MSDYNFKNFPEWLRNGNRYKSFLDIMEDMNEEIPLTKNLPFTSIIKNLDDFYKYF